MAEILLALGPESGSALRLCGQGFADPVSGGVDFKLVTRPLAAPIPHYAVSSPAGVWALFKLLRLHIRHNLDVALDVTPIVDGQDVTDQASTITLPAKAGWAREVAEVRFFVFAQKLQFRIETAASPPASYNLGQFYLDGAFLTLVPQAGYALT
jgi:hypothetical protein